MLADLNICALLKIRATEMLQYASDLHIDGWPNNTPFESFLVPSAPFLVLAGDICSAWNPRYFQFLAWTTRNWHSVFVIAGNHEYHNTKRHTLAETDARILEFCLKHKSLFYLQAGMSCLIPGTAIRIIGATLWCAPDPAMWKRAAKKKGDYRFIYIDDPAAPKGKRRLQPSDVYGLHAIQKTLLQWATYTQAPHEQLVVVTHYLPSKSLLEPEFVGEEWHTFYASDDDDLFAPQVKLWICGHSHRSIAFKHPKGVLIAMNARGYNRESEQNRKHDIYDPRSVQKVI
jgi:hypothetical protein